MALQSEIAKEEFSVEVEEGEIPDEGTSLDRQTHESSGNITASRDRLDNLEPTDAHYNHLRRSEKSESGNGSTTAADSIKERSNDNEKTTSNREEFPPPPTTTTTENGYSQLQAPRKRSRSPSFSGDTVEDDPFEEYERLVRRRQQRSESRESLHRRDSDYKRSDYSRHQRSSSKSYGDRHRRSISPYAGDRRDRDSQRRPSRDEKYRYEPERRTSRYRDANIDRVYDRRRSRSPRRRSRSPPRRRSRSLRRRSSRSPRRRSRSPRRRSPVSRSISKSRSEDKSPRRPRQNEQPRKPSPSDKSVPPSLRNNASERVQPESEKKISSPKTSAEEEKEPEVNFEIQDEEEKEKEEQRLIEERRRRRQQIMERYRASPTAAAGPPTEPSTSKQDVVETRNEETSQKSIQNEEAATSEVPLTKDNVNRVTVGATDETQIQKGNEVSIMDLGKGQKAEADSPDAISAADYDPSGDRIADDDRQRSHLLYESTREKDELLKRKDHQEQVTEGASSQTEMLAADYSEKLENPQPAKEIDMFAADLDIFAQAEMAEPDTLLLKTAPPQVETNATLLDNWDDSEGYYNVRVGEILDNRYQTLSNLGRGVFSAVVKARDLQTKEEVAIKIIRNNETMYKAGIKELGFLKKLMEADPENKKHIIRLLRHFEYRNHLCLVFESLSMNLRDVLKKYGKDVGISIKAVRIYAQQLFLSLSLLKRCNILHADIKPDNILVSESKNTLKLCDLGSASDASDNEITPYLVSRFYRAPEIIIGLPYDHAIDVWSSACTLYELFTGKILFPGRSNNQMLKHIMEVKGKLPNRMIKKGQFGAQHFDEENNFISVEIDRLTNKEFTKKLTFVKPSRDIKSRIMAASAGGVTEEEGRLILAFVDFLDKCLTLSPDKRMTPKEALAHPFITGKV